MTSQSENVVVRNSENTGKGLAAAWDRFWFTPTDPRLLCMIRIFCGLIVLYVHLIYSFNLQAIFGANGWVDVQSANRMRQEAVHMAPPSEWPGAPMNDAEPLASAGGVLSTGQTVWSVWFHVTDPQAMAVIHGCILAVMVMFTLGLWTRVTAVLTWLAVLSYIHRAPLVLFGLDAIMNVVLIYLVLAPCGAALSLDRLLARSRARRAGMDSPPLKPLVSANFALRLMQIHLCIVYLASGLAKLQGAAWWNGTAIWGTMVNYELSLVRYEWYAAALRFLTRNRWLWELVVTGGTVFTLAIEIGFPFLVWNRRLRLPMILGAFTLHTGIALIMGLTTFSLIMMTLVLAFVPAETLASSLAWLRRQASPVLAILAKVPYKEPCGAAQPTGQCL